MARVFVTQQPRKNKRNWVPNLEPATRYGAIHYIFSGDDRPYENPRKAIEQAKRVLANFDNDEDYILWPNTGDPAAVWATIIALMEISSGDQIQTLYWERKLVNGVSSTTEGFYAPVTFPLLPIDPPARLDY